MFRKLSIRFLLLLSQMTLNNAQWRKLSCNLMEGKNMIDTEQNNARIHNKNGGKCLIFAFKAAFAVDLGRRIDAVSKRKIESIEHDDSTSICLKFACAFRHDHMWYSGVAFNLDFLFYILMVIAAPKKKENNNYGYQKSSDETTVMFGKLSIRACRLVDYRYERLGATSAEVVLRKSLSTVSKAIRNIVESVDNSLRDIGAPDVTLRTFRTDTGIILSALEKEFCSPGAGKGITVWPWVDVTQEVDYFRGETTVKDEVIDIADEEGSGEELEQQTSFASNSGCSRNESEGSSYVPSVRNNSSSEDLDGM